MRVDAKLRNAISRMADYECLKRIEGEAIGYHLMKGYTVLHNSVVIDEVLKPSDEVKRLFKRAGIDASDDAYWALLSMLDKERIAVKLWRKRNNRLTLSNTIDTMIAYLTWQDLAGAVTQEDNDDAVYAKCERGVRAMHYLPYWDELVADAKAKAHEKLDRECRAMGDSNLLPEQKRVVFANALTDALYSNVCREVLYLKESETVAVSDYGLDPASALSDIVKSIIRHEMSIIADDMTF